MPKIKTWKNLGDKNGQCNSVVDIAWSHRRSEEFSNKHGSQTCENNSNYDLPSGQLTVCYGKSQILLGRSTITGPISIVCCRFPGRVDWFLSDRVIWVTCEASLREAQGPWWHHYQIHRIFELHHSAVECKMLWAINIFMCIIYPHFSV